MIFDRAEAHPGGRFLLVMACLVIIVAGLKAAAPILVPFALALFMAVVSMPVMFGLRRKGFPAWAAILLTLALDGLIFGLMILLVAGSLGDLNEKLPGYASVVEEIYRRYLLKLQARGLPVSGFLSQDLFDPARVFLLLRTGLSTVASLLSVGFIVAIIMIFILAEATVFPYKFQAILGGNRQGRQRITHTIEEVQAYLGIKFQISLARGVCVGLMCWAMRVDFPLLLGFIAFLLSFVPTIGSIIAAVPGIALALILHGEGSAVVVTLGYLVIDLFFGNLLEPTIMGRRMGLSTLVVVLSLLFWGWVWGPVGAVLSVPLTMVLKIALENVPDLRWIAVLLDQVPPQAREAAMRSQQTLYTSPGTGEAAVAVPPGDGAKRVAG
ncbi:MAG: AI-2E family transporter [Myxococcales bacterium]|nr:AI-2E family transporter [Myxococcales bacterium]